MDDPENLLRQLFDQAVEAVQPATCLAPFLRNLSTEQPFGRIVVVGAGKAAAAMAQVAEEILPGPLRGLVITRYGHAVPTKHIRVVEASHPLPDRTGVEATVEILEMVRPLGANDLVLVLLSGGGSALLSAPLPSIDLETKQLITKALLENGATISEINCVRKHLSAVKGGRLAAAAHPAKVITLAISDVTSDDPSVIASGPTIGDPTTKAEAQEVLTLHAPEMLATMGSDVWERLPETVKPDAEIFDSTSFEIVATARTAMKSAIEFAEQCGIDFSIIDSLEEGEAFDAAVAWAKLLLRGQAAMPADGKPKLLLSAGEYTVTHGGTGKGGPNQEFMLALAIALEGAAGIWGISCDTDGIDGVSEAAGAAIGPETLSEMVAANIDPQSALMAHDSAAAFAAIDAAIVTGPTYTNVNDFRGFLIMPSS